MWLAELTNQGRVVGEHGAYRDAPDDPGPAADGVQRERQNNLGDPKEALEQHDAGIALQVGSVALHVATERVLDQAPEHVRPVKAVIR